jgi:hypothetical protein
MPSKKIPILPVVEPSSIENPMHQIPSKLDRRGSVPSKKIPILPAVEPSSIENPMHQIPSKLDRRGSVPSIEFKPEHSRSRSGSKDSLPSSPKLSKSSRRNSKEFLPKKDTNESFLIQNPMDRPT